MGLIAAMAERNFQKSWEAWHNQPCPEVEEYEISAVTRCVTFDAAELLGLTVPERLPGVPLHAFWLNNPGFEI